MTNFIKSIPAFFKALIFDFRLKAAKAQADQLHAATGRKYLVITLNRRPVCVAKQEVKSLIRSHFYNKGVKPAAVEARAIYRTF